MFGNAINSFPKEIVESYEMLKVKRKLSEINRSKSSFEFGVRVVDVVETYRRKSIGKRGSWSSSKIVLSVENPSKKVTFPANGSTSCTIVYEYLRLALSDISFAQLNQHAIYDIDKSIEE